MNFSVCHSTKSKYYFQEIEILGELIHIFNDNDYCWEWCIIPESVTFWNNTSFSFIHQAGNIPSHLFQWLLLLLKVISGSHRQFYIGAWCNICITSELSTTDVSLNYTHSPLEFWRSHWKCFQEGFALHFPLFSKNSFR